MKIGFTGTRDGMTRAQKDSFKLLLQSLGVDELHHGDCVGADADSHKIARQVNINKIVIHPPTNNQLRARCDGDEFRETYPYLTRNRHIVDATEFLVACPKSMDKKGGPWYTINYAVKNGKTVMIIKPCGAFFKVLDK